MNQSVFEDERKDGRTPWTATRYQEEGRIKVPLLRTISGGKALVIIISIQVEMVSAQDI